MLHCRIQFTTELLDAVAYPVQVGTEANHLLGGRRGLLDLDVARPAEP
jgi:hypothetical protein